MTLQQTSDHELVQELIRRIDLWNKPRMHDWLGRKFWRLGLGRREEQAQENPSLIKLERTIGTDIFPGPRTVAQWREAGEILAELSLHVSPEQRQERCAEEFQEIWSFISAGVIFDSDFNNIKLALIRRGAGREGRARLEALGLGRSLSERVLQVHRISARFICQQLDAPLPEPQASAAELIRHVQAFLPDPEAWQALDPGGAPMFALTGRCEEFEGEHLRALPVVLPSARHLKLSGAPYTAGELISSMSQDLVNVAIELSRWD